MPALSRKFRPQRFADVVGQSHITTPLQNALVSGRMAHGYLFHGPRGCGKTTTARLLARRLNCESPEGAEPCGTCTTCTAARENRLLDVLEIDAASNRGIDDIRALQETVSMKPGFGKYKVYIVDEVHMLTKEAFTALLKTLEEPPANVVFVLASTEFHKIPETIISRCQVFHFRRASEESLGKRLRYLLSEEKRNVEEAALNLIIQRSDGCYRDGESLLGQVLSLHDSTITEKNVADHLGLPPQELLNQFLDSVLKGESAGALTAVDQALSQGYDGEQFIQESIRLARDKALALLKGGEALPPQVSTVIRALVQAMQDIAYVPEPAIALQLVIITVCTKQGAKNAATQQQAVKTVPIQPVTPPQPKTFSPPGQAGNLQSVNAVWPKVIDRVKATNPVASTFLRALKPTAFHDSIVHLEARYGLHQSFFEKADNKKLVESILTELLGEPVSVRCVLNMPALQSEARPLGKPVQAGNQQAQEDLVSAVKEVFGQ